MTSSASQNPVRIAILDDYQQVAFTFADWSSVKDSATVDVFTDNIADEDLLVKRLEPYTIISTMRERTKFTASLLDRLPNLRLLTTTGMRNRSIDVDHAKSKAIVVSGTGSGGNSTLEHIWTIILATARHIVQEHNNVKSGNPQWQTLVPFGLAGRTLGLVGVGRLGQQTAEVAKAFKMRVIGWSPHLTPERAAEAGVEFAESKESLLKQSDIVSLHMVLSDSTRNLIDAKDLALLKPTAFIINTSRGPLVSEEALVDVLREGKIAGAGLDVFDVEPLPIDHPLRVLKNVTLSPHNGYVNDTNYEVFWKQTVENIKGFLVGSPLREL